jgi:transposase InsO family protein
MAKPPKIPLPQDWPKLVKSALLHALALQRVALLALRAHLENCLDPCARLMAQNERLREQLSLRDEELRIKDARMAQIPVHNRPHYPRVERLAIMALRSRAGWTTAQTAGRFHQARATIRSWGRRIDEDGPDALLQLRYPVNRFSDAVALVVQEVQAAAPRMGRRKIAQVVTRAGLQLAASTAKRLRERPVKPPAPSPEPPEPKSTTADKKITAPDKPVRRVTARYPHHVYHIDITTIGTSPGLWVPWPPFSLIMRWIFCWHIVLVLDHFSRALIAFRVFKKEPAALEICRLLDQAIQTTGQAPKYIVSDQGAQFQSEYRDWCERRGVKPRFGAIGKHGSIAVLERMILSLKDEYLWRIAVPFRLSAMNAEMAAYMIWYNTVRTHDALHGLTPQDVLDGNTALSGPRLEPRARLPLARASPARPVRRVQGLELRVTYLRGRRQLPVIELREAA